MVLARTQGSAGLQKTKGHVTAGRLGESEDVRGSRWRWAGSDQSRSLRIWG